MKRQRAVVARKPWHGRGPGKVPFELLFEIIPWQQDAYNGNMFLRRVWERGKRYVTDVVNVNNCEIYRGTQTSIHDLIKILIEASDISMQEALYDRKERARARRIIRYLKSRS